MVTEPLGCISLARNNLRNTLADCAAFRAWVGASGDDAQEQALHRIYDDELPPPDHSGEYTLAELQKLRPYALIGTVEFGTRFDAVSEAFDFDDAGVLVLHLEWQVPAAIQDDGPEVTRRFENALGMIIDDLKELAGQAGYLAINGIEMDGRWYRSEPKQYVTEGDVVAVNLLINHGQER